MQITFSGEPDEVLTEMREVLAQRTPVVVTANHDDVILACRHLVRGNEKIAAIRLYRACFNVGLLDAKKAVEGFLPLPRF